MRLRVQSHCFINAKVEYFSKYRNSCSLSPAVFYLIGNFSISYQQKSLHIGVQHSETTVMIVTFLQHVYADKCGLRSNCLYMIKEAIFAALHKFVALAVFYNTFMRASFFRIMRKNETHLIFFSKKRNFFLKSDVLFPVSITYSQNIGK